MVTIWLNIYIMVIFALFTFVSTSFHMINLFYINTITISGCSCTLPWIQLMYWFCSWFHICPHPKPLHPFLTIICIPAFSKTSGPELLLKIKYNIHCVPFHIMSCLPHKVLLLNIMYHMRHIPERSSLTLIYGDKNISKKSHIC